MKSSVMIESAFRFYSLKILISNHRNSNSGR